MEPDLISRIQDRIGKLDKEEIENLASSYEWNSIVKKVIDGLMNEGGRFVKVKEDNETK